MAEPFTAPNLDAIVDRLVEELFNPKKLQRLEEAMANGHARGETIARGAEAAARVDESGDYNWQKVTLKGAAEGLASFIASIAVEQAFDVKVDQADFFRLGASGNRRAVAKALTDKMIEGLTGGSKSVEPSPAPAAAYLDVVLGQAFESWAVGTAVEIGSCAAPFLEQIQTVGEIGNRIVNALGIGDSSSRVLRPYIDTLVVEPLRRYVDKTYRPALLSDSLAVRQILRQRGDPERWREELRVKGYSEEQIEALINAQQIYFGPSDVRTFVERQHWSRDQGLQHLRDQGYDEDSAEAALRLAGLRRIEQLESAEANAIIGAYVDGRMSRAQMLGFLRDAVQVPEERALLEELADVRYAVAEKYLSPAEARRLAIKGIASVADYREALRRDRYAPDAVVLLEIELRQEMQEIRELEDRRRAAEAEKARLLAERQAEQERRRQAAEAERAIARRGDEGDLEAAAVRGLIPIARVEELYAARYDADTVAILVELLEDRREEYLEAQRRRDDALRRAERRQVDVGALERAVLANVLRLDEYRTELQRRGFDQGDVELLARTLEARKRDLDDARAKRADAEIAAKRRSIDLGRFELLVRRGARSFGEYAALLEELGYDEAARAALLELLELQIADDRRRDDERGAADRELRGRGLSLEEFRRAVVLELQSPAAYQQFLVDQGFTADRIELLMAELEEAVQDAEAARRRRSEAAPRVDARELPLSSVARAARLGIVSPAVYQQRLERAGYSAEDVEIELQLLFAEIADVQAARGRRDAIERELRGRGLSLEQLARAVKAGLQPLEAYQAKAIELGYGAADVATLLRVLGDELRESEAARARKELLGVDLKAKGVLLAELEAAVKAGVLPIAGFVEQLELAGLAPEDAQLLAGVLRDELAGAVG